VSSNRFLHCFYFDFFKRSLVSRSKNKLYITWQHVSDLCLTQLYSISQKVDLHGLVDLICPSISKIFQSIFKLLDRTWRWTCIPSVKKFSLWSNLDSTRRESEWKRISPSAEHNLTLWSLYEIIHIWTAVVDEREEWSLQLIF